MAAPRSIGRALSLALVAAGAVSASSCSPGGFQDPTMIHSVRILASAADEPYAKPGDKVTVSVLAYDGRSSQPEPMTVYWLPFVCENPRYDTYYACFQQLGGARPGADAGAPRADAGAGPGLGALQPGTDLTPVLPTGATYTFTMPADAVTAHPPVPGAKTPYGLAIVFNIACAGHVELVARDPSDSSPQQLPIGCFDSQHNRLGPDDYVFGFTRVYAYDSLANSNPTIDSVDIQGNTRPPGASFDTPHCKADRRENCPHVKLGPIVPPSSWATNPEDTDENGHSRRELIWVDFFATFGDFTSAARLLYDPVNGSPGDPVTTDTMFLAPYDPGDGRIWMVVHDNRGGAAWTTMPVHVCADGDSRCP